VICAGHEFPEAIIAIAFAPPQQGGPKMLLTADWHQF
jgi:hypothetical protein